VTEPLPPLPPRFGGTPNYTQAAYIPPSTAYPPPGGYRPPFAPHGPWAPRSSGPALPPLPPRAPRPPRPPKERSKLGRITFFMLVMVMGLLAMLDASGVHVTVSGYFAAALATIALGLIVGTWFGRARGLIFLAVLTSIGLALSSGAETWGGELGTSSYRPRTVAGIADRYDFSIGTATLDLRAVDFTGKQQTTTVAMKLGQLKIRLPDNVDATTTVRMDGGRAQIFGQSWDGKDLGTQEITDLGSDGAGGGTLRLDIQVGTGDVEVSR
jgi:hypothetical protein